MAESEQTIVMCYDISRHGTRRRVAARLEQLLCRVQMSVFEGRLKKRNADRLFDEVEKMMDGGDSLRMYVLSRTGLENSRVAGGAPLPEDADFWLF